MAKNGRNSRRNSVPSDPAGEAFRGCSRPRLGGLPELRNRPVRRRAKKAGSDGESDPAGGWEYQPAGDWKTESRDEQTGRTHFGLAAKDAQTAESTGGGQSSLRQASGPHNSHRRNKRHAAKGSQGAAQPLRAENSSHSASRASLVG